MALFSLASPLWRRAQQVPRRRATSTTRARLPTRSRASARYLSPPRSPSPRHRAPRGWPQPRSRTCALLPRATKQVFLAHHLCSTGATDGGLVGAVQRSQTHLRCHRRRPSPFVLAIRWRRHLGLPGDECSHHDRGVLRYAVHASSRTLPRWPRATRPLRSSTTSTAPPPHLRHHRHVYLLACSASSHWNQRAKWCSTGCWRC